MDAESKHAIRVLEAIAAGNERLIELKRKVQLRPEVTSVQQDLGLRGYQTGTVLEGYVDAELLNGRALAWWLEARWGEAGWQIHYSIRVNHEEGEDVVKSFPSRKAKTLDGFITQLEATLTDLVQSVDAIDWLRAQLVAAPS